MCVIKSALHLLFVYTARPGSAKFMVGLNNLKNLFQPKWSYAYLPQGYKSYNFYNFSMGGKFYIAQHWNPNMSSQNNNTFFPDMLVVVLAPEK